MRKRWLFAGIAAVGTFGIVRWQLARFFAAEPAYDVEDRIGDLEIRRYEERAVAETRVDDSDWDRALDEGFHRLAGYIFGGNRSAGGRPGETIAMTAPVNLRSERIAMTSPVNMMVAGSRAHVMTFTMPANRDAASLPKPNDSRVKIRTSPSMRAAVIRFRGRYTGMRVAEEFARLNDAIRAAGLETRGEPQFAGYDPPWTLPLLRRNEVWVEIA